MPLNLSELVTDLQHKWEAGVVKIGPKHYSVAQVHSLLNSTSPLSTQAPPAAPAMMRPGLVVGWRES